MSQYTDFLDSYLKSGNTLMELKDKGNLAPYYRMFKGVDTPPAQIKKDTLVQGVGESLGNTGDKVVTAQTQPKKRKDQPEAAAGQAGPISYYYRGVKSAGVPFFNFDDPKQFVTFTENDWQQLMKLLPQISQGDVAAEGDDIPADSPAGKQSLQDRTNELKKVALTASNQLQERMGKLGFEGTPGKTGKPNEGTKRLFQQMMGFEGWGPIKKAVLRRLGLEDQLKNQSVAPEDLDVNDEELEQQRLEDLGLIQDRMNKMVDVAEAIKKGLKISEEQKDFLRDCVRLRGARESQSRGVYLLPGDNCGGDFATSAAYYEDGGQRYGVKIGNQNSPIYDIAEYIRDNSKKGQKYQQDDGKALIFRGSNDSARLSAYRAMDGVMNEYGPRLAKAWINCGRQEPCKPLAAEIKKMTTEVANFNLDLLIFGAEQRNLGKLDDVQFADYDEDGVGMILQEIADANNGEIDGQKALSWYVGSLLNSWDAIASSDQFKDCEWVITGRGRTGIQPDGTVIDQDVQAVCPDGKGGIKNVVVNKKNFVKGGGGPFGDDDDNRAHEEENAVGFNVKTSNDGATCQYGKRGTAVIDEVDTEGGKVVRLSEKNIRARNKQSNYAYQAAKQNGQRLEPSTGCKGKSAEECAKAWREEADNYKIRETQTINTLVAAVEEELLTGGVETVMQNVMSKLGYEEAKQFGTLKQQMEDIANGDEQARKLASKRLRTTLTQGYRHQALKNNTPGSRSNIALEYAMCSFATANQAFAVTKPAGGETFLGGGSDGPGTAFLSILGIGTPDQKPAKLKSVTGTGVNFEGPSGGTISLSRRVKEGSMVTEATEDTDSLTSRLNRLSGAKAAETGTSNESRMKAEDFVRQLQELIKGIDKVLPVQN